MSAPNRYQVKMIGSQFDEINTYDTDKLINEFRHVELSQKGQIGLERGGVYKPGRSNGQLLRVDSSVAPHGVDYADKWGYLYNYKEDDTVQNDTAGTLKTALKLTTDVIPAGVYFTTYTATLNQNTAAEEFQAVYLFDGTQYDEEREEGFGTTPDNARIKLSVFKEITLTGPSRLHTLEIQFRRITAGTARVRNIRLAIWRIT